MIRTERRKKETCEDCGVKSVAWGILLDYCRECVQSIKETSNLYQKDQDPLPATVLFRCSSLISSAGRMSMVRTRWPPPFLLLSSLSIRRLAWYFSPSLLCGFLTSLACVLLCGWVAGFCASSQTDYACWHFFYQAEEKKWKISPPPPPLLFPWKTLSAMSGLVQHRHTHTNGRFCSCNAHILEFWR